MTDETLRQARQTTFLQIKQCGVWGHLSEPFSKVSSYRVCRYKGACAVSQGFGSQVWFYYAMRK